MKLRGDHTRHKIISHELTQVFNKHRVSVEKVIASGNNLNAPIDLKSDDTNEHVYDLHSSLAS
jgi:hypothetical protein